MILAIVIAVGMMSGFTLTVGAAGAGTDSNSGTAVTSETTVWNDGQYVVNGNITISCDVHLILTDGSSLIVTGDVSFGEGVSLTVYGQAQGTGTLTVNGGMANGIHGNNSNGGNAGSVTFNGGTVEVIGSIACGGTGGTGILYRHSFPVVMPNTEGIIITGLPSKGFDFAIFMPYLPK